MHNDTKMLQILLVLVIVLMTSCSGDAGKIESQGLSTWKLTPYHTQTPQPTQTHIELSTDIPNTPSPLPTPTPRIHVIQSGEDLGGIAYLYGVTVSSILDLNPDIDPYLLSIGTELNIPSILDNPTSSADVPTPVVVKLGEVDCYEDATFGFWCLSELNNVQPFDIESISAVFTLSDENGDEIDKKIISSPLKRVRKDTSIPLIAYFSKGFALDNEVSVALLSALEVVEEGSRYSSKFDSINSQVSIDETGNVASVNGTVRIITNEGEDNLLWVLAVAYSEMDKIVGLRVWNSTDVVTKDQEINYSMSVYSVGDVIARVEIIEDVYP